MRRWSISIFACMMLSVAGTLPAAATQDKHDCDDINSTRRIAACTELIETPGTPPRRLGQAYSNRALSYSILGQHETAIRDYDRAIRHLDSLGFPTDELAVALNNRAWALFKWGRAAQGMPDVQRSLQMQPFSGHSLDTRAHIHQALGDVQAAMRDYQAAMVYGGERMVTLYQCGLKQARIYNGPADGVIRADLIAALRACVEQGGACDPLPPDEECRDATS